MIPLETLFGNPSRAAAQLSPDGKKLSYLAPFNNILNVWVGTPGQNDARVVTQDKDRGVRNYFWSQDSRSILYLQDVGGNENWRLHSVDLATGAVRDLTPFPNVQVRIVDANKHFPNDILLAINKDNPSSHDVYHLDLPSGKLALVEKNPGNVSDWMADAQLKVRAALASNAAGGFDLLVRDSEKSPWRTRIAWSMEDGMTSGPLLFSKDGKTLILRDSRNFDTGRLVSLPVGEGDPKVIAEDAHYDVSSIMAHPDTYEIQAVAFVKDRIEWKILDESIKADIESIKKFQKGEFFIASRDDKDEQWIVGYSVDDGPASYYLYERKNKKFQFLFVTRPELQKHRLAPMEAMSVKTRDGLVIHGYITFPADVPRKNLPMVLNVHGGPWARDTWGYDPEAQWLASRGFICLQMNYRGSSGYGKSFLNAGNREWGGKMHDDLIDAVNWAVEKGYADPKRLAIYGGSYGGYAALVGATFTPDTFRCAVDIVGPSNLLTFIRSIPPYWSVFLQEFHKRVGNPDTEEAFLKSRSPLFHVSKIQIPMLIAQGANDPRVKQAESEQIVAEMKKKGIDHDYLLFPDEGHGFAKPENRIRFYEACEKFLARHLGS